MNKKISFSQMIPVLIVLAFFAFLILNALSSQSPSKPQSDLAKKEVSESQNWFFAKPPTTPQKPEAAEISSSKSELSNPTQELQEWVRQESLSLENTQANTPDKEEKLRKIVNRLPPSQKIDLKNLALNPERPVNERILSGYLLSLDISPEALKNLSELAQSELPQRGPPTPHSADEIQRGQDLALRYMAVDELAERALHEGPEGLSRKTLRDLSNNALSPEVRRYADRKWRELR